MAFRLVIAEKPSMAQTIAAALGIKGKQDGYIEGGGYLISWCVGHLVQLAEAAAYGEQYKKWSFDSLSVANRVTYFLEDFILEDGKVGYGGAYLAGKGVVGYAVFVQIPGNLIEVAADPAVLGCQLPDSGKQLVIDRRHMDNRAYGRPPYRLPEKFGLADTIGRKPRCEVGILIFGQPGFHNAAAVGRVVFLSHGVTSFLARKGA